MTKKYITQLVLASYKKNNLDEDTVEKIANLLTKTELKEYVRELKSSERKKTVVVVLPYMPNEKDQKKITGGFPNKKIMYMIDSTLMVGIRLIDNDLISEYNLKNTLDEMEKHVAQTHD